MGWLISALIALLVLSAVAFVAPAIFGPAVAGLAPLLFVIALIGIGAIWWRHSRSRVDQEVEDDRVELRAEDDHPET
jgi:uncharacterized membrane protein